MSAFPKTYRVYRFNVARNDVVADFITATHDDDAVAKASEGCASKCEVWEGRRLVAQLDCGGARTAFAS
ncbi:MAG: hypothetical protein HOP91_00595 [Sphingomonas sp.]|nr:hypothetical protein [Sphingomonas sp.]